MYIPERNEKRVLVLSGGGARGAWGGGLLKALHEQEQPDYRVIVGTSTGSLLAPLVALEDYIRLEKAFTEVEQNDIFNINPFNKNGKINKFRAASRILCGKQNLGETKPLKQRITDSFSKEDFETLKKSNRIVSVSVVSLTTGDPCFKSSLEESYCDMVDWVWASANQPIFMTAVKKDKELWVDGGIRENVPIVEGLKYAKKYGIGIVDVVIHNKQFTSDRWPKLGKKTRIMDKLLRTIDIFSEEVRESDIYAGTCRAEVQELKIVLHFMSPDEFRLCPESLLFRKPVLRELWRRGYERKFPKEVHVHKIVNNNSVYIR